MRHRQLEGLHGTHLLRTRSNTPQARALLSRHLHLQHTDL